MGHHATKPYYIVLIRPKIFFTFTNSVDPDEMIVAFPAHIHLQ